MLSYLWNRTYELVIQSVCLEQMQNFMITLHTTLGQISMQWSVAGISKYRKLRTIQSLA